MEIPNSALYVQIKRHVHNLLSFLSKFYIFFKNTLKNDYYLRILFSKKVPYATLLLILWSIVITSLSLIFPILYDFFGQSVKVGTYPLALFTSIFLHGNTNFEYTLYHIYCNLFSAVLIGFFSEKIIGSKNTLFLFAIYFISSSIYRLCLPFPAVGISGLTLIYDPIFLFFVFCCYKLKGLNTFKNIFLSALFIDCSFSLYNNIINPLFFGEALHNNLTLEIDAAGHIIGTIIGLSGIYFYRNRIRYIAVNIIEGKQHSRYGYDSGIFPKKTIIISTFFLLALLTYAMINFIHLSTIHDKLISSPLSNNIRQLSLNDGHILLKTREAMIPRIAFYNIYRSAEEDIKPIDIRYKWLDLNTIDFKLNREIKEGTDFFLLTGELTSKSGIRYGFAIRLSSYSSKILQYQTVINNRTSRSNLDEEIFSWFFKDAEQDVPIAQTLIGLIYEISESTSIKNEKDAIKWFQRAADQGEVIAQTHLAAIYYFGKGVEINFKEALKWYRKASEQNDFVPQDHLGVMYAKGKGTPKNYVEAIKWFRKSANQNYSNAQNNLAIMYLKGHGTPKNYTQAIEWFHRAALNGHIKAKNSLGKMYENGKGTPVNIDEAMKWYYDAAQNGDINAAYNIGQLYYSGDGIPADFKKAAYWFKKAAEKGHANAQYKLGLIYKLGKGTSINKQKALKWLHMSADQGNEDAQNQLKIILKPSK